VRVLFDQPAGLERIGRCDFGGAPRAWRGRWRGCRWCQWPMERTIGLVSLTLPAELRAALRERVAGLLNKPVRHEHLRRLLASDRPAGHAPQPAAAEAGAPLRVLLGWRTIR